MRTECLLYQASIVYNKVFSQPKHSEETSTIHFKKINDTDKSFLYIYPADIHEIQNHYFIRQIPFHTSCRLARHINVAPQPTTHTRDGVPGKSDKTIFVRYNTGLPENYQLPLLSTHATEGPQTRDGGMAESDKRELSY